MAKKVNQSLATRNAGVSAASNKAMLTKTAPKAGLDISLVIMMGTKEIILTGDSFKNGIDVSFTSSWQDAPELGTFVDGISLIGRAIGQDDLGARVEAFIENDLTGPLQDLAEFIAYAQLILTDLTVNTTGDYVDAQGKQDVYTLGLGFKFPETVGVAGISVKAFLVKYTYLKAHTTA